MTLKYGSTEPHLGTAWGFASPRNSETVKVATFTVCRAAGREHLRSTHVAPSNRKESLSILLKN
jgi:hypothetical protein